MSLFSSWPSGYKYNPVMGKFIEACHCNGLISIKNVAHNVGISLSYAYYLLKKLKSDLNFTLKARPFYEKLGLRYASCFLSISSNSARRFLFQVLSEHEYTLYISICDGAVRGLYCNIVVPKGHESQFSSFLELCSSLGLVDNYMLYYTSSPERVVMGFSWYDYSSGCWIYKWDDFVNEVQYFADTDVDESVISNYLSTNNMSKPIDDLDLIIIRHLEDDVFTTLKYISNKAGVTPQDLSYHMKNHVIKKGLIKYTIPYWLPIPLNEACIFVPVMTFERPRYLWAMVKALNNKPIARGYTICYSDSTIYFLPVCVLPHPEVYRFASYLDELKDTGLLKDHFEVIINTEISRGKGIPCNLHVDGTGWLYNIDDCINKVLSCVKLSQDERRLVRATERSMESR